MISNIHCMFCTSIYILALLPSEKWQGKNLQVVAVEGQHRLRWLHWWNLSLMARESLCFPLGEAKEIELGSWIVRASLWA